ncbi:MAG: hypothetical protein RL329_3393 [Bacteroidota bacterium]
MKLKNIIYLFLVCAFSNLNAQRDSTNQLIVMDSVVQEAVKVIVPTHIHFVLTPNYQNGNGNRNFYIGNNTVFKPTSGSNNYYIESGSTLVRGNQSWVGPIVLLNDGAKIIENPSFTNQDWAKFTYNKERIIKRQKLAQSKFVTRFVNFLGALGYGFQAGHHRHHSHWY